jgi:hypothetical protein
MGQRILDQVAAYRGRLPAFALEQGQLLTF